MNNIAQILLFLNAIFGATAAGEHILRLQEGTHTGTTLIGVEQGSSVLIRCEHPNGKVTPLRWLRGGTSIKPEYVKTKSDASYVEITNYQPELDDGVYECSAPGMSASYRLKGEKKHILPDGFRYCYGEEMANCKHADQCLVDISTSQFSCVCELGWMGASCDSIGVRTHPITTPPVCAYWPPVVTLLAFIAIIVLLAYCLYKFKVRNPHHYSKYTTTTVANNNNNNNKPPLVSGEYTAVHQHPPGTKNGNIVANMV